MKIEQQPVGYRPITVTFETKEEWEFMREVLLSFQGLSYRNDPKYPERRSMALVLLEDAFGGRP